MLATDENRSDVHHMPQEKRNIDNSGINAASFIQQHFQNIADLAFVQDDELQASILSLFSEVIKQAFVPSSMVHKIYSTVDVSHK
jgi:hypothetical protein